MIGVMGGGLLGLVAMTVIEACLMYRAEARDPFAMALQLRRETLRRMEQEALERHDEFVFYDASKEHGKCYQLFCCPQFGKITSRRIIYTQPNPQQFCCLPECLTSLWCKRVETMDYRLIDDVSVDQTCYEWMTGAGTIIVHCHGSHDTSIIADERNRLVEALQSRDLILLKQAERICSKLEDQSGLTMELEQARVMINRIEEEQKAEAKEKGAEWEETYVLDLESNTAQQIRVPSVTNPFSVMDDLSYRIVNERNPQQDNEQFKVQKRLHTE